MASLRATTADRARMLRVIAAYYGVTAAELLRPDREAPVAAARYAAVHFLLLSGAAADEVAALFKVDVRGVRRMHAAARVPEGLAKALRA